MDWCTNNVLCVIWDLTNYVARCLQLQLQHSATGTFGRPVVQDEELSRLKYRMETILTESDRLREMLDRTQQELGTFGIPETV
jgi:hypothetical protein